MMNARNESDKKAMCAIREKLYAINSYYAYQDFKRANPQGRRYDRKGTPLPYNSYSLSPLTNEARETYHLSQNLIWSNEREERIKAYIMRLRLSGELDKILAWEKDTGERFKNNPWQSTTLDREVGEHGELLVPVREV